MEIIPTVQGKDGKPYSIFMEDYKQYCKLHNTRSNPCITVDASNHFLDFTVDRLHYEDWKPVLEAISNDRSLHFISIRRGRTKSKLLHTPKIQTREKRVFTPNSSSSRHTKSEALHNIPKSVSRPTKLEAIVQETKKERQAFGQKLSPNSLTDNLMESLSTCLRNSSSIKGLLLENLPLSYDSLKILNLGIETSKYLQQLSLPYTHIGDEGCATLCHILHNRSNLVCINLTACDLTAIGIGSLCNLVKIQKLNRYGESWKQSLRGRNVDPNIMPGLRRLTLSHNLIGDKGVNILVETLIDDLWVKALDLQDCGITSIGGEALLNLITENECLSVVDIRGNKEIPSSLLVTVIQRISDRDCEDFQWLKDDSLNSLRNTPCSSRSMQKSKFGSFFSGTTISVLSKKGRMMIPHSPICLTKLPSSKCDQSQKPSMPQPPWNRNNNVRLLNKGKSDSVICIKKREIKSNDSNDLLSLKQHSVEEQLQNINLKRKSVEEEIKQECQEYTNNCEVVENKETIESLNSIESVITTLNKSNTIALSPQFLDCGNQVDNTHSKPHTIFELLLSN